MNTIKADVAIVGCGIAGSLAAVAAAREGADVFAIEENGYPGGSLTGMGTGPMMTFHAGKTQVIRGLGEELIARLAAAGLSPGHTVDSTGYTYTVTPFSAEGMKRELEAMMLEAGVRFVYHTSVTGARVRDGRLQEVTCYSCGETFAVQAEVFVDATGDGDLFAMAGVPFEQGRPGDHKDQPMTMNFKIDGVDTAKIRDIMARQPERFPFLCKKAGIEKEAVRLSVSGFNELMIEAIRRGEVTTDRDTVLCFETDRPGEMIVNMSRINGENPTDPLSLTRAETEGRRQVFELLRQLNAHIPGFEHARLLFSGPSVGVRSSRRMLGDYALTADDILGNVMPEDCVAVNGYPIDIHSSDGTETDSRFLKDGTYYGIPYRCLTNPVVPNLMAAGRNISCTFEAQASTRTSPCCSALGHAAGVAAAISAREGRLPAQIDYARLRERLLATGVFLG